METNLTSNRGWHRASIFNQVQDSDGLTKWSMGCHELLVWHNNTAKQSHCLSFSLTNCNESVDKTYGASLNLLAITKLAETEKRLVYYKTGLFHIQYIS